MILAGVTLRVWPLVSNNFYFTVDQGRDAVYVREILGSHRVFLQGPETTVRGIFAGPLWYYFLAIGYWLTGGHPAGGVVSLIILNTAVLVISVRRVSREMGWKAALVSVISLNFFWWHYELSRWAFNPFPLGAMAILMILSLVDRHFWRCWILVGLALNTNLAGAATLAIFLAIWGVATRKISPLLMVAGMAIIWFFYNRSGYLLFGGESFRLMLGRVGEIIRGATVPQNLVASVIVQAVLWVVFIRMRGRLSNLTVYFWLASWGILATAFVFLGASKIYRDWYTVYIPVLIFIATILLLVNIKGVISKLVLGGVLLAQFVYFGQQYFYYQRPSGDAGLLKNQLAAIDWIYQTAAGKGFAVYTYTDSYYDYPYQYLFWWYGKNKYQYLPCQFAIFPGAGKEYVPGFENYASPSIGCGKSVFLIIDSDTNGNKNSNWITTFRAATDFVGSHQIGEINVEERKITSYWREITGKEIIWRKYVDVGMTIETPIYWTAVKRLNSMEFYNQNRSVVVKVSRINKSCPRPNDTVGRYPGEINDFLLSIQTSGAMEQADELTGHIRESFLPVEDRRARVVRGCGG